MMTRANGNAPLSRLFSLIAAGVPIFSLPGARIRSFLRVFRRHVSRVPKAPSRESSLRHFIPRESLTSKKKRASSSSSAAAEAPFHPAARNTSFFLGRWGWDHVQEARKLFPSFFPSSPRVTGGCHPRSAEVNLIQKRRVLVSRFSRVHSLPPSRFPSARTVTVRRSREYRKHSRATSKVPISVAVRRWDMSLLTPLFRHVCMRRTRCIVGIRRVQCKNCARRTYAKGKS